VVWPGIHWHFLTEEGV